MAVNKKKKIDNTICVNRKATHEYFIEEKIEAGISLQGWEVKALRAGKANISEAYVMVKHGEVILIGATINPLKTSCNFVFCDPTRTRKLLVHRKQIDKLMGQTQRQGYTIVPLKMYFSGSWAKIEIGVAKGKQDHDKRDTIKNREWQIQKSRIMKKSFK